MLWEPGSLGLSSLPTSLELSILLNQQDLRTQHFIPVTPGAGLPCIMVGEELSCLLELQPLGSDRSALAGLHFALFAAELCALLMTCLDSL